MAIGTFALAAPFLQAQDANNAPQRASSPKIGPDIVVLAESVVQTQWTNTLSLVNAPQNISLLNPGQCIRVGIYSNGEKRDEYLKDLRLSFRVSFSGHIDLHAAAPLSDFKQIKPEGGDFVNGALGAAGIKPPEVTRTFASLGASAAHWCAPIKATDGTATVEAEVETPDGHQTLNPSVIQIESFETGSKKSFRDAQELGAFLQTYYRQPNSARLLPALQFMIADQIQDSSQGKAEILAAFLSAATRSDPIVAKDFQTRIAAQDPLTRAFGLLVLRSAGYDMDGILQTLSTEDRQKFLSLPALQDPFDQTPTQELFTHLDMLWAVYGATGQFKPVKTVASALGWKADYEDFAKLRDTPNHSTDLTPSIVRGVVYTAAGWSLSTFQRNDPLVADYIEYLLASPDTSQSVKSELAGLSSNPAFKQAGRQ